MSSDHESWLVAAAAKNRPLQMALFYILDTSQCVHLLVRAECSSQLSPSTVLSQRACTRQLLPASQGRLGFFWLSV